MVMIDNGGNIVVDLESFSKFNEITLEQAREVMSLCTSIKVEEAMLEFSILKYNQSEIAIEN